MELKENIERLISAPLTVEGFEIVEIKLARFKRNSRLQIFVDSDNGVRLDDCARLSKIVESVIEENKLFDYGFVIEVSSPGLDRPLVTVRDFRRRIGEVVQLTFNDMEVLPVRGKLLAVDDDSVELQTDHGPERVGLETVRMGKIIF